MSPLKVEAAIFGLAVAEMREELEELVVRKEVELVVCKTGEKWPEGRTGASLDDFNGVLADALRFSSLNKSFFLRASFFWRSAALLPKRAVICEGGTLASSSQMSSITDSLSLRMLASSPPPPASDSESLETFLEQRARLEPGMAGNDFASDILLTSLEEW